MRRKIIKQGHNTLTITLPSNWVQQFRLKAGDEVEIAEKDNGLFITTQPSGERRTATINIESLDIPTIWKYFMAVYREGYDEVKIFFKPGDTYENPYKFYSSHMIDLKYGEKPIRLTALEIIHLITSRFVGFEVMENYKNYCVIKDMAEPSAKEFDASLRRVFLLIKQMSEEMRDAIKTNNSVAIHHAHEIDINIDKFHDYCLRVLNKTGFKDIKKSHLIFSTLYLLELIGDEFKHVAYHMVEDMKGRKLNNLLELENIITEQFNTFYHFFYNFDRSKIIEMSNTDYNVHFYLPRWYSQKGHRSNSLSPEELEIFNHFRRVGHYINALVELRIEMEY